VLALLSLDPRLALKGRRDVLRLLAGLFHDSFDAHKVGKAASRLREYHDDGLVGSYAFGDGSAEDQTSRQSWGDPDPAHATSVMTALFTRYGAGQSGDDDILVKALRLVGVHEPVLLTRSRRRP